MKRWTILGTIALITPLLVGCGGGVDWEDPNNPLCVSGHWEDDWETKSVYKYERKYDSMKKKYVQKRVKNGTKLVNDRDWVCDVRSS